MKDNAKTLENGFAKGMEMIEDIIVNSIISAVQQMLKELPMKIGFSGFTGQTQTSYMAGIYVYGSLRYIVTQKNWTKNPVRGKLKKGQTVFLANPYEGQNKTRKGYVDVGDPSGASTSLQFLRSYNASKKGISLVVTTGTEYSEFLETMFRLDVLTRTFTDAPRILNQNWKKIDKP